MNKTHKACRGYMAWKSKHQPQLKPWLFPEQSTLPRLNPSDIESMKEQLEAVAADETNLEEDELDNNDADDDNNMDAAVANGQ